MAEVEGSLSPDLHRPAFEYSRKAEKAERKEKRRQRKAEREAAFAANAEPEHNDDERERRDQDKERERKAREKERELERHRRDALDAVDHSRSRKEADRREERDREGRRRDDERPSSREPSRPRDERRVGADRAEKRPREADDDRGRKRRRDEPAPERDRDRDRQRDRERERERHREQEKDRDHTRDSKRDRDRGRDQGHDDKDHERGRSRDKEHKRQREEAEAAAAVAARDDEVRATEAQELEAEAEKRRKRIEAWQALKRKQAEEDAQANGDDEKAKAWTWDDESDDDDATQTEARVATQASAAAPMDAEATAAADDAAGGNDADGQADMEEGGDEIDPLDAFMAENDGAAAAAISAAQQAADATVQQDEAEEVDPLDAFMAAEVLPAVKQEPEVAGASGARQQPASGPVKVEALTPSPVGVVVEAANGIAPAANGASPAGKAATVKRRARRRYVDSDDSSDNDPESASEDDEEWARNVRAGKTSKGDKLGPVDHSKMNYRPFRRNFYIEVPELARMSEAETAEYRKQLDGIKVRGKDIPKPVKNWNQCGISSRVLDVLKKGGLTSPMPIQAQALPVVMSGRDCIGVAKTGSGKTLAFVLPMLRHIKDQPPLLQGDGPIALIMAPTRELVQQIGKDVKRFGKPLGINCVCVFGGSGIANQISELKRGTEVVVCTPGRMIDILVTSGGKITNLRRVTYLVLDEADRMFDMGFEPQISRITQNIRPDRQNVMFSATFPRSVETLARQMLKNPIEIQVGGRSVVNSDITQMVELRAEDGRFLRLLEILGLWYEKGKLLIFVGSQEKCDDLFRNLLRSGYPCLSLHGGKDQSDRESTIADFKSDVCNVLIATSVAARGLDVKDLVLVVNYDPPNHHEDYVHRVGRTGRAGNKGTAITFIGPDEERYAPDLVKALRESGAPVPADLLTMAEAFGEKRKRGEVQGHGSGFGGTGFKFDSAEDDAKRQERKAAVRAAGYVEDASESDDDDKPPKPAVPAPAPKVEAPDLLPEDLPAEVRAQALRAAALAAKLTAEAEARSAGTVTHLSGGIRYVQPGPPVQQLGPTPPGGLPAANPGATAVNAAIIAAAQAAADNLAGKFGAAMGGAVPTAGAVAAGVASAQQIAARLMQQAAPGGAPASSAAAGSGLDVAQPHYEADLEINDFPQHARWKIMHRETVRDVADLTGAAITTRGVYVPPGHRLPEGERKLYLLIQGPTEQAVKAGKAEVKRILEETTERVMRRDQGAAGAVGRYSVM